MNFLNNALLKKSMKIMGYLSLFLATIVMVPTSSIGGYQPKCPNDLLK